MTRLSIITAITLLVGSEIECLNRYTSIKRKSFLCRSSETGRDCVILRTTERDFEGNCHDSEEVVQNIETLISIDDQDRIIEWMNKISKVERGKPYWLEEGEIMTVSPSKIIQSQLEEMFPQKDSPCLFPSLQSRKRFDEKWRNFLASSFEDSILKEVIDFGRSNTHPLRLQLVAVPKGADFVLHAHAGVEMAVPLVGELRERRVENIFLPEDILQRTKKQLVGVPGSTFSTKPTPEELQRIGNDLAEKAIFEDHGSLGIFVDRCLKQGEVLINDVGSVHQSYTSPDRGCLFFGLAANLHVHFLPGNFKQRKGVGILNGIEDLLGDDFD